MKIRIELSHKDRMGRIPTPKKGGAMRPKKGRGSYTRKPKHKERYV